MKLTFRPIDSWPGQLRSDAERAVSPFNSTWSQTKRLLDHEVDMLANGGKYHTNAVIQLAVPEGAIRQDGQLRAGRKAPEHPGVILSFEGPDGPLRFSCDRFRTSSWKPTLDGWQVNARAIALGLEALRKVDRYGLGTGTEQYRGFQALGSGIPMGVAVMTKEQAADLLIDHGEWGGTRGDVQVLIEDSAVAQMYYRSAVKTAHPDAGGDPELFRRLTAARDLLTGEGCT